MSDAVQPNLLADQITAANEDSPSSVPNPCRREDPEGTSAVPNSEHAQSAFPKVGGAKVQSCLGKNIFPKDDPRYSQYEAIRYAEAEEIAQFNSEFLKLGPIEPTELLAWIIQYIVGAFDIHAKWVSVLVGTYEAVGTFEQWLSRYSELSLSLGRENCPATISVELLQAELRVKLLQRVEYWKAEAYRLARECGQSKMLSADSPPTTAAQASDHNISALCSSPESEQAQGAEQLAESGSTETQNQHQGASQAIKRRNRKGLEQIETVRLLARKMLAEKASHREICLRLKDMPRPPHAAWRHLPWDKAYYDARYASSVAKWISINCRG